MKNRPSIGVKLPGQAMSKERRERDANLLTVIRVCNMTCYFLLPATVKVYVSALICIDFEDGDGTIESYMSVDMSVRW
jgi:hypothetical protein